MNAREKEHYRFQMAQLQKDGRGPKNWRDPDTGEWHGEVTSDFGWWARFEWTNGDWKYTEDPENAYRFATPDDARNAIVLVPAADGEWHVVEYKDEPPSQEKREK